MGAGPLHTLTAGFASPRHTAPLERQAWVCGLSVTVRPAQRRRCNWAHFVLVTSRAARGRRDLSQTAGGFNSDSQHQRL